MPSEANVLTFGEADSKESSDIDPFVIVVRNSQQMGIWLRNHSPALQWIEVQGLLQNSDVWELAAEDTGEVPLDVVLRDPGREFPDLYRLVDVRSGRDVRVSMLAAPGFLRGIRLAASLGLPMRLLPGQPAAEVLAELQEALVFYLRDPMVEAPIEFFHSVIGWLRGEPTGSLWKVLEEDPAIYRRDAVDNRLTRSQPSNLGIDPSEDFGAIFVGRLIASGAECASCPWCHFCAGYFKWPDPDYSCTGVKRLFSALRAAVDEIEDDLSAFETQPAGSQSSL
jgi:hypothetical protein